MSKKSHLIVFFLALTIAVILGGLDYETRSISDLFLKTRNIVALGVYTLLFMTVSYTGIWMYVQAKLFLNKKPTK